MAKNEEFLEVAFRKQISFFSILRDQVLPFGDNVDESIIFEGDFNPFFLPRNANIGALLKTKSQRELYKQVIINSKKDYGVLVIFLHKNELIGFGGVGGKGYTVQFINPTYYSFDRIFAQILQLCFKPELNYPNVNRQNFFFDFNQTIQTKDWNWVSTSEFDEFFPDYKWESIEEVSRMIVSTSVKSPFSNIPLFSRLIFTNENDFKTNHIDVFISYFYANIMNQFTPFLLPAQELEEYPGIVDFNNIKWKEGAFKPENENNWGTIINQSYFTFRSGTFLLKSKLINPPMSWETLFSDLSKNTNPENNNLYESRIRLAVFGCLHAIFTFSKFSFVHGDMNRTNVLFDQNEDRTWTEIKTSKGKSFYCPNGFIPRIFDFDMSFIYGILNNPGNFDLNGYLRNPAHQLYENKFIDVYGLVRTIITQLEVNKLLDIQDIPFISDLKDVCQQLLTNKGEVFPVPKRLDLTLQADNGEKIRVYWKTPNLNWSSIPDKQRQSNFWPSSNIPKTTKCFLPNGEFIIDLDEIIFDHRFFVSLTQQQSPVSQTIKHNNIGSAVKNAAHLTFDYFALKCPSLLESPYYRVIADVDFKAIPKKYNNIYNAVISSYLSAIEYTLLEGNQKLYDDQYDSLFPLLTEFKNPDPILELEERLALLKIEVNKFK